MKHPNLNTVNGVNDFPNTSFVNDKNMKYAVTYIKLMVTNINIIRGHSSENSVSKFIGTKFAVSSMGRKNILKALYTRFENCKEYCISFRALKINGKGLTI